MKIKLFLFTPLRLHVTQVWSQSVVSLRNWNIKPTTFNSVR